MKNGRVIFIFGILIGALGIYILTQSSSQLVQRGFQNRSMDQDNLRSEIDAHFIEQMIPHHEDAITMSVLALEKATRPEVRELAQNIISSQAKEIEQMKKWYKEWFGKDVPAETQVMQGHGMMGGSSLHMGMMGSDVDLENLEASEDFDSEYVEQMIPHHQMAVMMATMLKNGTTRPEMKKLAEDIVSAQTSEIDLMRNWLSEWE